MTSALGNLRVLDFSRVLAGPFASMLMADLGATVIKVERPGGGDETRGWGPPWTAAGGSTYYEAINRNKHSVALDLADPGDLACARRLAAEADVVLENFRPGVMARLGLDHETLAAANPGLVYCTITGFGTGDGAVLPGYDLLVQALGGLMSITGSPDGEPQKVGVALVDILAGQFATIGILAALAHRTRTGEGQLLEVDLLSSLLAALANQASAHLNAGVVPQRMGNQHPSIAPYELYRAADADLVLAVGNDRQFAALAAVLGRGELAGDERFATNTARVAHRVELKAVLDVALAARPAADWVADLSAAGVPAGQVNDIAGAFALADRLGLNPVVELDRGDGHRARSPRNPIGLAKTPPRYRLAPPPLPERRDAAGIGWERLEA